MNTIYDNTFVLGETSATNFIAGNGIKIDSPSAGTVRIGNDETVLYSGAFLAQANNSATISEPITNFETIKIYASRGPSDRAPKATEFQVISASSSPYCIENTFYNSSAEFYSDRAQLKFNNTAMTCVLDVRLRFNTSGYNLLPNAPLTVSKIVGMNRISGSNA